MHMCGHLQDLFRANRHRRPVAIFATVWIILCSNASLHGQQTPSAPHDDQAVIQQLLQRVTVLEAQIRDLKVGRAETGATAGRPKTVADSAGSRATARPLLGGPERTAAVQETSAGSDAERDSRQQAKAEESSHEHTMELPGGGPALKIRGFFDFNLGLGTSANPLIFPLGAPPHNTFQAGEFDLFMTSELSDSLSFLSEVIIGSDATNEWGLDIERVQLTYKPSDYFQISGGRYHTSIGYYNTAFHHGTWFQTATGRPFMYFFEDSGGILPVHSVGITTTGLVPRTGKLNLHWIAEADNGRGSSPHDGPQNFLSDKNHKAFNLAGYLRPDWIPGLQLGGSYYRDRMVPAGMPHVTKTIESAYAVYVTPVWEFMNELVVQRNRPDGQNRTFNTPLAYTQISRKFGKYRPYFRYQYVNVPSGDPIYAAVGRYDGPSAGMRFDFSRYAALKIQYNRLYRRNVAPANGVDGQVAFAF
jgi:hypothetical protein